MPSGTTGETIPFQQYSIFDPKFCKMVKSITTNTTTTCLKERRKKKLLIILV